MRRKRIIKIGLFLAGLLGLTVVVYFVSCELNHRGPRLEFEEYVKDLGTMREGASQEVLFKYRNTGNQELLIYKLFTKCSCQEVEVTDERISPGASGTLKAVVKADQRSGPITDSIAVRSSDIDQPIQYVKIKRFVVLGTIVKPERLTVRCQPNQACPSGILTVAGPTNDHEFKIMGVENDAEAVKADFRCLGTEQDNRRLWEVKVIVDTEIDKLVALNETTELRVVTSDKVKPTLVVPLAIVREVPVRIQPRFLTFVLGGSQSSPRQQVCVTFSGDDAGVDVEPYLNESSDIRIRLVSKRVELNKVYWIFEADVNDTTISSDHIRNGTIQLRFVPLDIYVRVPFSIVRLDV